MSDFSTTPESLDGLKSALEGRTIESVETGGLTYTLILDDGQAVQFAAADAPDSEEQIEAAQEDRLAADPRRVNAYLGAVTVEQTHPLPS